MKKIKLNIQIFGGRGASSSFGSKTNQHGVKFSASSQEIARQMIEKGSIRENDQENLIKDLQKNSFGSLLKYAENLEKKPSYGDNRDFANEIMFESISEALQRKNYNKWTTEFGRWREK